MEVAVGLHVDLDRLRAGGGERLKVEVGAGEHQVDVAEEAWCDAAAERDDVGPEGEVRHEVGVHDVDVQGVGAGRLGAADLIGERTVVRRQERGKNLENHAVSIAQLVLVV